MLLLAEQHVVDCCHVNTADVAIAVNVAIHKVAGVAIEQIVVKRCHVNTRNMAVAVHVARDCCVNRYLYPASSRHILIWHPTLVAGGPYLSVGEIYVVFYVITRGIAWIDIS